MTNLTNFFYCAFLLLCNYCKAATNIFDQDFHFIIVGGGSAGSVVASRLSEDPRVNVLLLEAGGYPPIWNEIPATSTLLQRTQYDWQFKVEPQLYSFLSYINHEANYPLGKMLGGGSSINDMTYVRGNSWDYDNWEQMGNTGWGYKDVLPFFLKAEGNTVPGEEIDAAYHNSTGPLTVSRAPYKTPSLELFLKSGEENGYSVVDINGKRQEGISPNVFTMRNGARCSTVKAYIQPARSRPNLVIATNCFVTKIKFDRNKRATGVDYINDGWKYRVQASKEVILSAGAIGSPQILILSGVGPESPLHHRGIKLLVDLPGVGRDLHDHVGCSALTWSLNCSQCTYDLENAMSLASIESWLLYRNGPLTVTYGNEGTAFVKSGLSGNTSDHPDVQIVFISANLAKQAQTYATRIGASIEDLNKYFGPLVNHQTFTLLVINVQPKSRGPLILRSANPMAPPRINFNYFSHPDDIKVLVQGMKIAMELGNSKAFAAYGAKLNPTVYPGCENVEQFSDAYLECVARHFTMATYHPAGSCKMGVASDPYAVVDANLKVYKVNGLRVIDASIMPQITSGDTNAPTIMIGEKGADAIKKEHGLK